MICLGELHSDIGCITPCGHCFHRECWDSLKKNHDEKNDESKEKMPKCPVCKSKAKKFVDIYLTFEDKDIVRSSRKRSCSECSSNLDGNNFEIGNDGDSDTDDATKAVASLTSENMRLRKSLQELKSVSKGQGELLLDVLPRFDELQSKLAASTKEKERMEKELRDVEEENSEMLAGWNEIEMKMQIVKIERDELEERLKESKQKIEDLNTKWNDLDQKLIRAKKKRKILESQQEVELNDVKIQIKKSQIEKDELLGLLKKARAKATNLKRAIKKLKRKQAKESNGSSPLKLSERKGQRVW